MHIDYSFEALSEFRRRLHSMPELSGLEARTASVVAEYLRQCHPDALHTDLAGHGVLAVFDSGKPGPHILMRADLDALPIAERSHAAWHSTHAGISHACGHDGHMAMLCGAAVHLSVNRPARGAVACLFQPAEENGLGAAGIAQEPAFQSFNANWTFALHNLPGQELGALVFRHGAMHCASIGVQMDLCGETAHAAWPERGISPAGVMSVLMRELPHIPRQVEFDKKHHWVTLVHARLGEPGFGTAPGHGTLWATLRSRDDAGLDALKQAVLEMADAACSREGVELSVSWHDHFPAVFNNPEAVSIAGRVAEAQNRPVVTLPEPLRVSEDFGALLQQSQGALIGLGAGVDCPPLHRSDYDFPDELLKHGVAVWTGLVHELTGQ